MIQNRFCLVLLCVLPLVGAAQDPNLSSRDRKGTATIAGRITSDGPIPQPIRRAIVILKNAQIGELSAITDDDGRFVFARLSPGYFNLAVRKTGYPEISYGATHPNLPGKPIAITGSESIDVTIPLPRGGVLVGSITDQSGNAVPGVMVSALRVSSTGVIRTVTQTQTDDRGIYRMFGLPSGNYRIAARMAPSRAVAAAGGSLTVEVPSPSDIDAILSDLARGTNTVFSTLPRSPGGPVRRDRQLATYAPVYFPGVTSVEHAASVALKAGEEYSALDFRFDPVPVATITGIVSGLTQAAQAAQLSLQPIGYQVGVSRTARSRPDGRFAFMAVPPGRYRIIARLIEGRSPPSSSIPKSSTAVSTANTTNDADMLYATTEVQILGDDFDVGLLYPLPASAVSGRIRFESIELVAPKGVPQIRIQLTPTTGNSPAVVSGTGFSTLRETRVQPDGTFSVKGIAPGKYAFRVILPQDVRGNGWRVREAVVDGRDLLDVNPEFQPGSSLHQVVVTLSDRYAVLAGTLEASAAQTPSHYTIVVFSTDIRMWDATSRRTQLVRPGDDGHFSSEELPPGEYFVCAVTEIDTDFLQSSEFFERLISVAVRIQIAEGERKTVHLRVGQ
jgi:hypothetical protein